MDLMIMYHFLNILILTNATGAKPPQRVSFVETLTKILCDNIPDFWRLGQSYLSGKLLKEVYSYSEFNLLVNILQLTGYSLK